MRSEAEIQEVIDLLVADHDLALLKDEPDLMIIVTVGTALSALLWALDDESLQKKLKDRARYFEEVIAKRRSHLPATLAILKKSNVGQTQ